MTDARRRKLEREAAQGDLSARIRLGYEHLRTGTIEDILPIIHETYRAGNAPAEATELGKQTALAYANREDIRTALEIAEATLAHCTDPQFAKTAQEWRELIALEERRRILELTYSRELLGRLNNPEPLQNQNTIHEYLANRHQIRNGLELNQESLILPKHEYLRGLITPIERQSRDRIQELSTQIIPVDRDRYKLSSLLKKVNVQNHIQTLSNILERPRI
ncbi:hypothetical protein J4219_07820 [Candidatus Woesearchaeota archaeon]|nr:hypothetical protein [Candidatus Woesearchaeota archaeon]